MHPMKNADRGGTTSYWMGAAQLEVGGSCPVRFANLRGQGLYSLGPVPSQKLYEQIEYNDELP